jgi:hypothetical protein
MGGGLMQLVAYGAQDVYLTGNPQITFFKVVYRRHTNFACEAIEQTFNGSPTLGGKSTVQITRNGDLVTKMWLKTTAAVSSSGAITAPTSDTDIAPKLYTLGTASTTVNGAAATDTITLQGTGDNEVTATLANAAALSASSDAPDGTVIEISGVSSTYNGFYTVKTEGTGSVVLNALASASITAATAANTPSATDVLKVYKGVATAFTWNADLGYALINSVELQIGGTKIDKHYGRWMHIWSQLTRHGEHDAAQAQLIGPETALATSNALYVPLQFFCCRNDGLALPLIALQYHDVRLEFDFSAAANVASTATGVSIANTTLLVNYVYLDSEERKRFAQASHEYLIEQLQFTGVESVTVNKAEKIRLNFNHPVKELVWAQESAWSTFSAVTDSLLQLNGHDRFSSQPGAFFNYLQPHTHHTRTPSAGINVYSFALKPEEHQPSGTCNFSRIDNATLTVTTGAAGTSLYVYGVNYNVLRIMSGMGGVAYSN